MTATAQMGDYLLNMADGYMGCAVWTTLNDDGTPIPATTEVGPGEWGDVLRLCADFLNAHPELLTTAPWATSASWAGSDLFLTRNGHGAGFWDRGAGAVGDDLSRAARALGEIYPLVADDGMLYNLAA